MQSRKFYLPVLVTVDMLQGSCDQPGIFAHLVHRFKVRVGEAGYGLLTRPIVRVRKPDLMTADPVAGMVRVDIVARVVPIQRLENVQS